MKAMVITSDWIDRYHDGELGEPEKRYFLKQLDKNQLLRAEVNLDARLNSLLSDGDILELMDKVQEVTRKRKEGTRLRKPLLVAAAIVCLLILGTLFYFIEQKPASVQTSEQHQITRSLHKVEKDQVAVEKSKDMTPPMQAAKPAVPHDHMQMPLLAENYRPMAEFELLVGSVTRSTGLKLIAPAALTVIAAGTSVRFKWISQASQPEVILMLMNNHGRLVCEIQTLHNDEYTLQTRGMPPGLYYWKIMYEDELVTMGKITLK